VLISFLFFGPTGKPTRSIEITANRPPENPAQNAKNPQNKGVSEYHVLKQ
jgi:hypothetical protein